MKNKAAIFLLSSAAFLGMATVAAAATITLPNPLCPNPLPANATCIDSFPLLITTIINFLMAIIASLAVLMFVWAGILLLTAGADPANVQKGKHAIIYGIIGLAIALSGAGLVAVIQGVIGEPTSPDGACCLTGGSATCIDAGGASSCAGYSGTYRGDGTTCATVSPACP